MILWDQVRKSIDDGVEAVVDFAARLSERVSVEVAVARLMFDKGGLDTKFDRLAKQLGERVCALHEQKSTDVMADGEVVDTLRDMASVREEQDSLQAKIRKASLGEEE